MFVVDGTRGSETERNKFYLHEVVLQKISKKRASRPDTKADSHQGDVAKLLKEIVIAKGNDEKVSKDNPLSLLQMRRAQK